MDIVISLLMGAVAGWVASLIMGTKGGLLRNILIGIVGGFLGTWLFSLIGISGLIGISWVDAILTSAIGACILIFVGRLIFK